MSGQTSGWRLWLASGEVLSSETSHWSEIAEEAVVGYLGGEKRVFLVEGTRLMVHHGDLEVDVPIPAGARAYQAMRSNLMLSGGGSRTRDIGRCVGIVVDGEVVEERFLNGLTNEIMGVKL